ncbi:MAG: maltotransferase domain-containing protein [Acidimicrobiales bacterium]
MLTPIVIDDVHPRTPSGFAAKAVVGESVPVSAVLVADGHDLLAARARWHRAGADEWHTAPLTLLGNDHWTGSITLTEIGAHELIIDAWTDRFATWRHEVEVKSAAQLDIELELEEGAQLLEELAERVGETDAGTLRAAATALRGATCSLKVRLDGAFGDKVARIVTGLPDARFTSSSPRPLWVDRPIAAKAAWYEFFPRSFGGLKGAAEHLPYVAGLGFDVVYLPPIHPIGETFRKGRGNTLTPGPDDPGSPWAIGGMDGGHTAVHPELGTLADFERLVARGREVGTEIALDFAIQCSPDHPWLREHPEWFHRRPDGTLKYAENPPKRYQDIYNVNFACEDWRGLWEALRDVVRFWVERGVRCFRVDNPHTKPIAFWEWLIADIRADEPDVVFLAEAFARPAMMTTLAKAGFAQSYTYFTWKNTRWELTEFVRQLVDWSPFYRPNFFANTPDILHEYLQQGGKPAFELRLVLAATLSPSYGIYSGYEHCENVPVAHGSEEYLDSEKFEVKQRALDGPLLPLVRQLNEIRRAEPALQRFDNLRLLDTHGEHVFAYWKAPDVAVAVNLDPRVPREDVVVVPSHLGLPEEMPVTDLLTGTRYRWRHGRNYVGLAPGGSHVFKIGA